MKLVRRARYCAPIAERKSKAAEVSCHLVFQDISFRRRCATEGPLTCVEAKAHDASSGPDYSRTRSEVLLRKDPLHNVDIFESNLLSGASYKCKNGASPMKF